MWRKFLDSFHDSETIVWSRAKAFVGTIMLAIVNSGADMSVFLSPKWLVVWQIFAAFLVADGAFSEYARRRRADDLYDQDTPK